MIQSDAKKAVEFIRSELTRQPQNASPEKCRVLNKLMGLALLQSGDGDALRYLKNLNCNYDSLNVYSTEEIYLKYGQYDKSVTLSFGFSKESHELYGQNITGCFLYTQAERLEMEERIKSGNTIQTDGTVKFKETLSQISADKIKTLKRTGVLASDIVEILQSDKPSENSYVKKEIRNLPEPIKLKTYLGGIDVDQLMEGHYNELINNGYGLCPFELDHLNALELTTIIKNNIEIPSEFIDEETGKVKDNILFYYLAEKHRSEEEESDLRRIKGSRIEKMVDAFFKELKESHSKRFNNDQIILMTRIISEFEPELLLRTKVPIWWEFERFIHIFLRHVSELQTGKFKEKKTPFQYHIKDITNLIKSVLNTCFKEIELHFETNATKPKTEQQFSRRGAMDIYYMGDYYTIHIDEFGKLMAFHKRQPLVKQNS